MNIRYECALLKNISQGTPVIPVFAAEMTPTGDFKPFDIKRASAALPHVQHARQASASNMIAELRYSLPLSFSPPANLHPSLLTDGIHSRGSIPPEKTSFLNSISDTIRKVSLPSYLFLLLAFSLPSFSLSRFCICSILFEENL